MVGCEKGVKFLFECISVCPVVHVDGSWDLSGMIYFSIYFKANDIMVTNSSYALNLSMVEGLFEDTKSSVLKSRVGKVTSC